MSIWAFWRVSILDCKYESLVVSKVGIALLTFIAHKCFKAKHGALSGDTPTVATYLAG